MFMNMTLNDKTKAWSNTRELIKVVELAKEEKK